MENIKLTIDNREVEVPKGTTILDAAKSMGIRIPTLCHMKLEDLHYENNPGACRICVVEIEGRRNLAPSCKMECTEGMVVRTHTPRVMNARKTVMELILSNHPAGCLTCSSNGYCELQTIAHDLGIREIRYQGEQSTFEIDRSPSIVRNMNKCIMCRRCETMCNNIQTVGALTAVNRGFNAAVSTAFERDIAGSTCSYCGQCVSVCPVNALSGRNTQQPVLDALANPAKIVIAQTAPAVRTALGRDFGCEPGTLVTGKMVSALRQLGFDYVFDTDFAADLTIMEEGTELLQRLSKYLSGDEEVKIPISIYTRELARLIRYANINFNELPDSDFDHPLGESTGAGVIFGTTGGVIEAACRTAYELYTKKPLERIEFKELRGLEGIRSGTINFDGVPVKIGIAHGLGNARKLVEEVKSGKSPYHVIEIMACPGGCIGGGGQPFHQGRMDVLRKRAAALYSEDESKPLRKSHENPYIQQLYKEYLGEPCGPKAHELLHTHYFDRKEVVNMFLETDKDE